MSILCALALSGVGLALAWIPCFPAMAAAAERDLPARGSASEAVSTVFIASAALGEYVGPVLGGHLTAALGFAGASAVSAALCAGGGVAVLCDAASERAQDPRKAADAA